MNKQLREPLPSKLRPQNDAISTFMAFLFMLACLMVLGLINGRLLFAAGATDGAFKYLSREIYLSLALTLPVLLPSPFGRIYSVLLYLAVAAFTAASWLHGFFYNAPLSAYVVLVLKETYFREIYEFSTQFFSGDAFLRVVAAFLLPLPFLILSLRKRQRSVKASLVILLGVSIFVGINAANRGLIPLLRRNYLADFAISCVETRQDAEKINAALDKNIQLPEKITKEGAPGRVIVLVIGESSSRRHYSLYGYPRPTTPRLDAIKPELFVFSDVISPNAHTIPVLTKILAIAEPGRAAPRFRLIPTLKAAGYHVVALSNQPFLGKYETEASKLLSLADEVRYLNTGNGSGEYLPASPDGVLLPPFEKSLAYQGDLVIILHLMGSHSAYNRRAPESLTRFENAPPDAAKLRLTDSQVQTINDYDTSIAYTDIVLSDLLAELKQQKRPAALLYLSDHGEALYEDGETRGHAESAGCRYMYEIPFLLWLSEEYKLSRPEFAERLKTCVDRPWQSGDLAYAVLRLAGVSFAGMDFRPDILSSNFTPQRRLILGKDYDALFSDKVEKE